MAEQVNPDIQKERNNATFNVDEITYILDGGEGLTKRRREVEELALSDPVYTEGPNYPFLSRPEKYEYGIKKSVHYIKQIKELGLTGAADAYWYRNMAFPNENPPIGLHLAMFLPTLTGQCNAEQKEKWVKAAENYEILGTYAQTEMGHGTHIRGVETTATYDVSREEFVINSPTLTAYKWWPGGLGKTSNHVVLMAQLIIKGKSYGLHPFIVQIRDMKTHEPMPGVSLGDIGPKFGYDMIDNGYLGFDNYRIPRENMLMKNSQVSKDGTYKKSVNEKLSYGTMVFIRAMIVYDVSARGLAQACTIATRYSAVRHQSELKPGGPEPQILDYQTQQYKLLPLLASAYAFWFAGREMRDIYFQINYEIQQGNTELLPELHALSAGLKAFTSTAAAAGIEQCRLSCGGHGYSHASGIPKIYVTATPAITYEGENTVMLLQTARYLIKAYNQATSGKKLGGLMSYLTDRNNERCPITTELSLDDLVNTYKFRAARQVTKVGRKMSKLIGSGSPEWEARNLAGVDLCKASMAHCHYWIVKNFVDQIRKCGASPSGEAALTSLGQLYALYGIEQNSGEFLEDGYMSSAQLSLVEDSLLRLLAEVRTNAVALVDAFDFRDHLLQSVLGRYDGNVYENLYKWAQQSPLNKTQVHDSYYKHLKPMMGEKSKL